MTLYCSEDTFHTAMLAEPEGPSSGWELCMLPFVILLYFMYCKRGDKIMWYIKVEVTHHWMCKLSLSFYYGMPNFIVGEKLLVQLQI